MSVVRFLGQNISVGEIVGDCFAVNQLVFHSVPTIWNPVEYLRQNGGIPATDQIYTFTNAVDTPVLQMRVRYTDATHFVCQYRWTNFDLPDVSWINNSDGEAIDINNITEYAALSNGLDFYIASIVSPYYSAAYYGRIGMSIGISALAPGIGYRTIEDINTGGYEEWIDAGDTKYRWDGTGDLYSIFASDSSQQSFLESYDLHMFSDILAALSEEINDFEEDYNTPDGGHGNYRFYSDNSDFPGLPSLSILDCGLATMWSPDPGQMQSFSAFLWSSSFIDNILKLLSDPLDNVIMCGIVPFDVTPWTGASAEVGVGNTGTGVYMRTLNSQFIQMDMGAIKVKETWETCLDYSQTQAFLYLPYIGTFQMDINEIMNSDSISILYNIDLLSGDCIAFVKINKYFSRVSMRLKAVTYEKIGNLMCKIPLSGSNYGSMFANAITGIIGGAISGNPGQMAQGIGQGVLTAFATPVERTGGYTGVTGLLGSEKPYILLTQPVQAMAASYNVYEGFPSFVTYTLGDLHGFTKVEELIDNTIAATETEKAEIERLLKEGVIL